MRPLFPAIFGRLSLALLACGLLTANATAEPAAPTVKAGAVQPPSTASPAAAAVRADGYLGKDRIPDTILILPPPPREGSSLNRVDKEVYTETRALAGSARWMLAARDAVQYIQAFDCPLGLKLEQGPPEVLQLLARMGRDASLTTNLPKDHFARQRPFVTAPGAICVEDQRAGLTKSFGYPSGHATYGWALGLILAELAPDRASALLARARAFGESRVVCGVHTVSDIEEGRTNGAALVAVLHSDPVFRADLEKARAALAAALAQPHLAPDAGQCRIETEAEAHTPWINPTGSK